MKPNGRLRDWAPIDKVEASLGVKLPEEESEHFETFGGYVCGMMGTLPEDGASFELSTEQMNVRRIERGGSLYQAGDRDIARTKGRRKSE